MYNFSNMKIVFNNDLIKKLLYNEITLDEIVEVNREENTLFEFVFYPGLFDYELFKKWLSFKGIKNFLIFEEESKTNLTIDVIKVSNIFSNKINHDIYSFNVLAFLFISLMDLEFHKREILKIWKMVEKENDLKVRKVSKKVLKSLVHSFEKGDYWLSYKGMNDLKLSQHQVSTLYLNAILNVEKDKLHNFFKEVPNTDDGYPAYNIKKNELQYLLTKNYEEKNSFIKYAFSFMVSKMIWKIDPIKRVWPENGLELIHDSSSDEIDEFPFVITGQLRNKDCYEILENTYKLTKNTSKIKYYVYLWETYPKYSNIMATLHDENVFTARTHDRIKNFTPESIKTVKKIRENLPKTFEKLTQNISDDVNVELIKKIFNNNVEVKIFSEKDFHDQFDGCDNLRTRGGTLNQFKMFYLIGKVAEDLKNNGKRIKTIFRARPDVIHTNVFEASQTSKINTMYCGHVPTAFTQDSESFMDINTFYGTYYHIYKELQERRTFELIETNSFKISCDSHKLLTTWAYSKFIRIQNKLPIARKWLYDKKANIIDVTIELEEDLNNSQFTTEEKKEIKNFFELLMTS